MAAEDYIDLMDPPDDDGYEYDPAYGMGYEEHQARLNRMHKRINKIWERIPMKNNKKNKKSNKPMLLKVGKHYINPCDVRQITQVRKDLYVVKFMSEPNPEYACWVSAEDISALLAEFNIIMSDE